MAVLLMLLLSPEQPGGAHQQDYRHDDEDDRRRSFRIEHLGQSLDQAKSQAGDDRTENRAHAADYYYREDDDDDVGTHQRMYLIDRRGQNASQAGERDAEAVGERHHQRHVDAKGLNQLGILGPGSQISAKLGPLDHEPSTQTDEQRGDHYPGAIFG